MMGRVIAGLRLFGMGMTWFAILEPTIAAYIENYVPPKPPPRPPYRGDEPEVVPLVDQATWRDFVHGLRTRDDYCRFHGIQTRRGIYWDVLGEAHSYLHTIARGREVAHLEDWVQLGPEDCDILTGNDTDDGTWGLLGNFSPFTKA